jgi:DNA-binding response OmpR family regulator
MTTLEEAITVMEGTAIRPRLLLVDDNDSLRFTLPLVLQKNGFDVSVAANVNEALKLIGSQTFDALLTDLHMPDAGDGLTVVSAMRHANPRAVTLIFSGYPAMKEAAEAILSQTDGILVKPLAVETLVDTIRDWIKRGPTATTPLRQLSDLVEYETVATIASWLQRVDAEPRVISVKMSASERCEHLPQLFHDLVFRLRFPLPLGTRALVSDAAALHGARRRQQGYTAAMMVEESRMLQVSIFQMLQDNLQRVDFSLLLMGVMAIADEVDSQLAQAMSSYVTQSQVDHLPVMA